MPFIPQPCRYVPAHKPVCCCINRSQPNCCVMNGCAELYAQYPPCADAGQNASANAQAYRDNRSVIRVRDGAGTRTVNRADFFPTDGPCLPC